FPVVLTVEAVAERLLTTPDAVRAELDAGRLDGFKVNGEWRTTEPALLKFMNIPSLAYPTPERTTEMSSTATAPAPVLARTPPPHLPSLPAGCEGSPAPPFDYRWPNVSEHYDEAYETRLRVSTREVPIRIGFCNRKSAGDPDRRRAIVFMGYLPS